MIFGWDIKNMSKKTKKVNSAQQPPKEEKKKNCYKKKPSWKDLISNEFYLSNPLTTQK